jgi:acyl-CoA synthetase
MHPPGPGPDLVARYEAAGWWGRRTLSQVIRENASARPGAAAFVTPAGATDWARYDSLSDEVAASLAGCGVEPGERVGVLLPDGAAVHCGLLGCERAGVIAVGIGSRAGDAEIAYLLRRTGARALVCAPEHRGRSADELVATLAAAGVTLERLVTVGEDGHLGVHRVTGSRTEPTEVVSVTTADLAARALGPNELFLLNSTSGTTGLPKCVTQFQNRWFRFSQLAVEAGELTGEDVFFGAVPAPFGFGLWTSHFAPAVLGVPTVVLPRFSAEDMVAMIERERVSVLCCVSTQFRMLLNSPAAQHADLSSLRVMFTGGEAVPYDRALEFERRTGATVLQFFGSNETGALSYTTREDPADKRLTTAGRLIPEMEVRLVDEEGRDVTDGGGPGRPAGRGPLTCLGYYDDPEANRQLYTDDGWMLMGDLVTLDGDGYLQVVGRTSDFIIRGGKNISAAQVEAEIETHPSVDLVAVVPVPDPVFGERVCAVVSPRPGRSVTLPELSAHLDRRGVSKELHPEHLLLVDELPRSSGGKVAKGDVRRLVETLLPTPT